MMEHEPSGSDDISERLIPEIPGVIPNHEGENEWGELTEEPDEESQEDIIEEFSKETRKLLVDYGIEGAAVASQEDITHLWGRMGMNTYLVSDLALLSIIEVQDRFKNLFKRPKFRDLIERSEITENPYDVRVHLVEAVAPGLERIGYGSLNAYRLPQVPHEGLARAFKVEGWLAGLFFMEELPEQLKIYRADSKDRKLKRGQVFKITIDEIVRQARIAESDKTKREYDLRVASHHEAYEQLLKTIKNAYKIADLTLSKYIAR